MSHYEPSGELLAEGKTKKILQDVDFRECVNVVSKDDLTAGNGKKHDVIPGKGRLSNITTCNVFQLLKACGVPVVFREMITETAFRADKCEMIAFEVVGRRYAFGSYRERRPYVPEHQVFPRVVFELFLKTSGKRWKNYDLEPIGDDPFVQFEGDKMLLFGAHLPLDAQVQFLELDEYPLSDRARTDRLEILWEMEQITREAFLVLEKAWQLLGCDLYDFKLEFGFTQDGRLVIGDVVDNESCRVLKDGVHINKQAYRDGAKIEDVMIRFEQAMELTSRFRLPKQKLILWTGSPDDSIAPFQEAFEPYKGHDCIILEHTCSAHKTTGDFYTSLHQFAQQYPDSVICTYVGRSNGAGTTASANTILPVISVVKDWKEFPDDVWSSLRTPSQTPLLTCLEPKNAVLAAVDILAKTNPRLYALRKMEIEERLVNLVHLPSSPLAE